ncbi:hypothetical protein GVM20_14195 [Porphyrobacter sp. SLTP]|uniref:Rap1a/Tai family immunity protein n=1 Tax=Porphyrobacter sp. SLTP TaxID=2683266 RepID=UPI00141208EA|nr:Rap1a/Tai family immunity protein [Porphyrobacter sp. SLTP]NBB26279.1 hypothetical protein [Porphyrobacter sp. SLTP]
MVLISGTTSLRILPVLFAGVLSIQGEPLKAGVSFATAGDVLQSCDVDEAHVNRLICNGYIRGILGRDRLAGWADPELAYVCELPQGVSIGQLIAVVIKHIKARPEIWHVEGTGVALTAIKDAFCNQSEATFQR